MGFSKFASHSKFDFKDESKTKSYVKPVELAERVGLENAVPIRAFYKNTKSKFGDTYVAVIESDGDILYLNLPAHMNETVAEIMESKEAVALGNEGKAGLHVYTYETTKYGTCYGVDFVDYDAEKENGKFLEVDEDELPFE